MDLDGTDFSTVGNTRNIGAVRHIMKNGLEKLQKGEFTFIAVKDARLCVH